MTGDAESASEVQALEQLRSLDRRLVALEGELQTPPSEHCNEYQPFAKGWPDEVRQQLFHVQGEVEAIGVDLASIAAPLGLEVVSDFQLVPSTSDVVAAHGTLAEAVRMHRDDARRIFDALVSRHPHLSKTPGLADDAPLVVSPWHMTRWRTTAGNIIVFAGFWVVVCSLFFLQC